MGVMGLIKIMPGIKDWAFLAGGAICLYLWAFVFFGLLTDLRQGELRLAPQYEAISWGADKFAFVRIAILKLCVSILYAFAGLYLLGGAYDALFTGE